MSGLTKYEKESRALCGYPNYKAFSENFSNILDKEVGYHIEITMKKNEIIRGRFRQKMSNHMIYLEGIDEPFKGRDLWYFFKNNLGMLDYIENVVCLDIPKTREEYVKQIINETKK